MTPPKALGIAAECLGLTRADYLEEMVKSNHFPCYTRVEVAGLPCNTWKEEHHVKQPDVVATHTPTLPKMAEIEALRDQAVRSLLH